MNFVSQNYTDNYVVVYKRHGEDPNKQKVEKPQITKVPLNREIKSAFNERIAAKEIQPLSPVFVDYDTDINKAIANGNAINLPAPTAFTRRAGARLSDADIARLTDAQLVFFGREDRIKPSIIPSAIGDIPISFDGQQGDIAIRGAAGWIILGSDTKGKILKTNGTGANPSWQDV